MAHVLSKGANASTQLTQVDLRMIQEGGIWKTDRLWMLAKGIAQRIVDALKVPQPETVA